MRSKNNFLIPLALMTITLFSARQISLAQWTSNGPFGGSVKTLLVSDTTLYVGTFDGGVYRSASTQAYAWQAVNYAGLTSGHINALAAYGDLVFAGTADAGIFISSDRGDSWDSVYTGLTNRHILSMTTSGSTVLAGTDGGGVFVSTNNGASWSASNSGLSNLTVTTLATGGGAIFAGTSGGGVWVRPDGAASWTEMNTGLGNLDIKALAVMGTTLIAGTADGIYFTDNLNPAWVSAGLTNVIINGLTVVGTTVYVATSAGVFTSPAGLLAWTPAGNGYNRSVNAVAVFNNNLIEGTQEDGLINHSLPKWIKANLGFNNLKTYALYNYDSLVLVATNKGLYISKDDGVNYFASNQGITDSLNISSIVFQYFTKKLFLGTRFSGVFMSSDTGKTWVAVNNGLPNLSITHLAAANHRLLAAATNEETFIMSDSDLQWTLGTGLPAGLHITALAADDVHACLGTDGMGAFETSLFASSLHWNTFGLDGIHVTSMSPHPYGIIASTAGSGVYIAVLPGNGFYPEGYGSLPTQNILSVGFMYPSVGPAFPQSIAGFKGGVYYTKGYYWSPPSTLLYIPPFADVLAISSYKRIYIATANNSVYSASRDDLPVAVHDLAQDGAQLLLSPNPSHGQFRLALQNVDASIEEVAIYDQTGRLVKRFVYENEGQVLSISTQLAPGVYAVCVKTAKGQVTQQLVIE